jgi:chromosomal replication initiator protein
MSLFHCFGLFEIYSTAVEKLLISISHLFSNTYNSKNMDPLTLWQKAQDPLKNIVGNTSYTTWFSSIRTKAEGDTLIIETPDEFFKNWISDHYLDIIRNVLQDLAKNPVAVALVINPHIVPAETHQRLEPLEKDFPVDKKGSSSAFSDRFTFENFVIGPSNRFASAASLAVAENPAKAYNPLFIYGQVGLGKTHLIQAISQKIHESHPSLKLCYLTSERFTNELIEAIRHRSTQDFRRRYREVDVLLVDDIHFIAGKESTQEEFFHTFNNLHNNHKQIIITSDRPPKEIANLEERLISRFAWGLIADIQPPDFETRVAILHKKMEPEPVKVPEDVIYFIAEQIKTNIRELEGALIRVAAYALLEDTPLTLDVAKMVLKDMVKATIKTVSVEMIQKEVAEYFKILISDLKSKKRYKTILFPRQVAMYLTRQLTSLSLPEIGAAFGGKDHTTVLHSCKKVDQDLTDNEILRKMIQTLTQVLKQ